MDDIEFDTCVCGGQIERYKDDSSWYHSRIEDFSHTPTPEVAR